MSKKQKERNFWKTFMMAAIVIGVLVSIVIYRGLSARNKIIVKYGSMFKYCQSFSSEDCPKDYCAIKPLGGGPGLGQIVGCADKYQPFFTK